MLIGAALLAGSLAATASVVIPDPSQLIGARSRVERKLPDQRCCPAEQVLGLLEGDTHRVALLEKEELVGVDVESR